MIYSLLVCCLMSSCAGRVGAEGSRSERALCHSCLFWYLLIVSFICSREIENFEREDALKAQERKVRTVR